MLLAGITGILAGVGFHVWLYTSAVVSFVLTEKYYQDPEFAASIVFMSTLFSLVTIPIVFSIIL